MDITNPAFNYESLNLSYSLQRTTDPRIEAYVHKALSDAKTILNVGAGAGSYEPSDKYVIAIEPSASMRAQRLNNNKVPALNARAEMLPFDDNSFDASMAIVTIHHWSDLEKGLKEMRRVTKGNVVIMTFDPDALHEFWNAEYFPELIEVERKRYPKIKTISHLLGGPCEVIKIPIPLDCKDGFQEAYYGRPEAFLNQNVRLMQSAWGFLKNGEEVNLVKGLADDLKSGNWDNKFGHFRTQDSFTGALRLVISKRG